jgi:autotransporter-associated beta strand protein
MVLSGTVSNGGLIKTGAGTLLLSGANNYTGDTTVNAGTLEIGQATLATGSTVSITGGAYLQLDFSTTNQVAALVLDGNSQQPGVYGYGNGYSEYFAGNGYLRVISGPSGPAYITNSVSGSYLSLSWQAGQGWRLQVQTNSLTTGLGTNWFYVTDGSVSSTNIMIDATKPTVFYRLTYP